jgi:hypothetical protein
MMDEHFGVNFLKQPTHSSHMIRISMGKHCCVEVLKIKVPMVQTSEEMFWTLESSTTPRRLWRSLLYLRPRIDLQGLATYDLWRRSHGFLGCH